MNKFLAKSNKNLSQNCGPESIRYKYRMIRLTDEQWERIRSHFPEEHIADGRPGRKPIPTRRVLEAVLWLLNTGAQWHMLPQSYAAGSLSASSPGSSGSAESSSAGSTIPRISWALFNSPASLSSSGDFEIGSSNFFVAFHRVRRELSAYDAK